MKGLTFRETHPPTNEEILARNLSMVHSVGGVDYGDLSREDDIRIGELTEQYRDDPDVQWLIYKLRDNASMAEEEWNARVELQERLERYVP